MVHSRGAYLTILLQESVEHQLINSSAELGLSDGNKWPDHLHTHTPSHTHTITHTHTHHHTHISAEARLEAFTAELGKVHQ